MTRATLAVAVAAVLAACSPNARDNADNDAATSATNEATTPATAPPAAPQQTGAEFVLKMAASDMFEIESGRLAAQRGRSAEVKAFGTRMVTEHTATTNALKTILAADTSLGAPPTALPQEHQDRLAALRDAEAGRFDELYLDQQQEAHENALSTLQVYAQNGDNERLRQFATETAPKVNQHLQMIRDMDQVGADEKKS